MISRLTNLLKELDEKNYSYHLIEPLILPKEQRGSTCGYYATSYVTGFYHASDQAYPTLPARKKDTNPKSNESYHQRGKNAGIIGTGGIWDVRQFQLFLPEYQVTIGSFDTKETMSAILLRQLHLNQPVIITLDMAGIDPGTKTKMIGLGGGKNAHYVTIVGYYKTTNGSLHYIYNTWSTYHFSSEEEIFNSSNNLKIHPARTEFKTSSGWQIATSQNQLINPAIIKIYNKPDIDLSNIRNCCVLIQPLHFDAVAHYTKALNMALAKEFVNIDIIKTLFKNGAKIDNENHPITTLSLVTDLYDDELEKFIEIVIKSKTTKRKHSSTPAYIDDEEKIDYSFFFGPSEEKIPPCKKSKITKEPHFATLFHHPSKPNEAMKKTLKELKGKLQLNDLRTHLSPNTFRHFSQSHKNTLIYLIENAGHEPSLALQKINDLNDSQLQALLSSAMNIETTYSVEQYRG